MFQLYKVVSRPARLTPVTILFFAGWNERALEVHPEIAAQDAQFRSASHEVQEKFVSTPSSELLGRQNDFIRACSGNVEPIKRTEQAANGLVIAKIPKKERRWEQTLGLICEGKNVEEVAVAKINRLDGGLFFPLGAVSNCISPTSFYLF